MNTARYANDNDTLLIPLHNPVVAIWYGDTWLYTAVLKLGYEGRLLIVLGFNDSSTLVGHFVSSPREREER